MKYLSRNDEMLLLSILRLKDDAYGVTIRQDVLARTGKKLTFGALWVSLDNLARKGYVVKRVADPTPARGGRGKIYYRLTSDGVRALQRVRDLQQALWAGIPQLSLGAS
jgi:PadR family transcriptional regulator PadR